ncbi:MAG: DEAD/DEAH box helicase, partial [Phycisphaerae bacterium]
MSASTQPGYRLSDDIQYLPGVGPKRAEDLRKLGVETIGDLLEYLPARHEYHESRVIENLEEGIIATVVGRITRIRSRFGGRGPTISATLIDNTGRCSLVWFNAEWMRGRISEGTVVRATGRVQEYQQEAQLVNPKCEILGEDAGPIDESEPATFAGVYPASAAISSRAIARLIASNLERMLTQVEECHPPEYLSTRRMAPRRWALRVAHEPTTDHDVEHARRRLAYDELLLLQLATSLVRHHRRARAIAQPLKITDVIDRRIRLRFPFSLTPAQDHAVAAIVADLAQPRPMNRLLQGDVGCGKTVVALYAALTAVANKTQVAIMAPTEILAEQHAASIRRFLAGSRVRHELLLGGMKAADRRRTLADILAARLDLVVGTHALIQSDVHFGRLGLVIIDEQHRF